MNPTLLIEVLQGVVWNLEVKKIVPSPLRGEGWERVYRID